MNATDAAIQYVALEFPHIESVDLLLSKLVGEYRRVRRGYHIALPEPYTVVIEQEEANWWKKRLAEEGYYDFKLVDVHLAGDLPSKEVADLRRRRSPPKAFDVDADKGRQAALHEVEQRLIRVAKLRKEQK